MGWKKTLREIEAAQKRAAREAERRQKAMAREAEQRRRAMERRARELEKEAQLASDSQEVKEFEAYINGLVSAHKQGLAPRDWERQSRESQPTPPVRESFHEDKAAVVLRLYEPTFWEKLRKKDVQKVEELEQAVAKAKQKDDEAHLDAETRYKSMLADWEERVAMAQAVLDGDLDAYLSVLTAPGRWAELTQYGVGVDPKIDSATMVTVELTVGDTDIVPANQKRLLKSGKLSVKAMPKGQFYGAYQDHVCGSALRVARDIFAYLPVDRVIVTAATDVLDTSTGYSEKQVIFSVMIPREGLERIRLGRVDASDAMANFVTNMTFKKTAGFVPVDRLTWDDFEPAPDHEPDAD